VGRHGDETRTLAPSPVAVELKPSDAPTRPDLRGTGRVAVTLDSSIARARGTPSGYLETFRTRTMSGGLYVLPAGATDRQAPHGEDEVYLVLRGKGRLSHRHRSAVVAEGDLLEVSAGEEHRFHAIEEELVLFVCFSPPEGSARPDAGSASPT
jgi:mannose-6-phosphate isomerase-like protein (cupin superfamily)